MKNLLITIYLGSMLFSANAMQPFDDDYDPSIDVTTFSTQLNNTHNIGANRFILNNPPVLNNTQRVFFDYDDDYDPSIDVTTFSIQVNNPPVLNNHQYRGANRFVPNNNQHRGANRSVLQLNDFGGNINDEITVHSNLPDISDIVIDVLSNPVPQSNWGSVIGNDSDLGFSDDEKNQIIQKLREVLFNPETGSYDKIIKVKITTPRRDEDGNIRRMSNMRLPPVRKYIYIPEWFLAQDGSTRFVNNINNLSIDEIANNLTQSCAKKIVNYTFDNIRLFDQILDDRRRKAVKLIATGGISNTFLRPFLNVDDNANLETLVNTLGGALRVLGIEIGDYAARGFQGFFDDNNLPDDQIKCLGGKIALFLKLVKTTGYIQNAAYDVIFGEPANYSGFSAKKNLRQVDVFAALCTGSRIPENPNATNEEKKQGNQYAKNLFFRALKLLFNYNGSEDTGGIKNFFQAGSHFWEEFRRPGNLSNEQSKKELLLNSLFFHCEDIAGVYGKDESGNDLESIRFSDYSCKNAVTDKFGNAYVKIVDPEEQNLHGFRMAYSPYRGDGEVFGVSSNKICPPAQSRYIFRAFEKLMDRCDNLDGAAKEEVLHEIASIMGVLIQGFNHCDAGVAAAYNEAMKTFLPKEGHIEYDALRYGVMQFAAEEIFNQLFQYKNIAGSKEAFIKDGNFDSAVTLLFGESTMGVKYVRHLLNGRYGIGTVNGEEYARNDDDYKRRLQVHLLGGRARSTVIRKALGALYDNPSTQKWGIKEDSDSCWPGYFDDEDEREAFIRDFAAGDRAFDWVRTNSSRRRINDYSYYPSWWQPSSAIPEDARNMTNAEYDEVIRTMLDGVMSDLDLVLDVAIDSPLMSKLFDAYLRTCDLIEPEDENDNANSGRRQENTVDIFSWVAGIDAARQRELKKQVLFKIIEPTTEDGNLFIEPTGH